ncbi:cob(I)yrinic acid a,c-diamide adenosyltransferase [Neisseria sp. Ec49-e6-T10]|uniref:cob(I)yrinic acid a,c-diamide adenosyltransferase n=1 Tax=Neisseria sp. Ec49-e6-T10 TaxID=3140744 RepID=UPI003EC00195
MGYRLSKIITKTGDKGTTGLGDGSRVSKTAARVEAMGDIDELNASIGMLILSVPDSGIVEKLSEIQHDLFDVGSQLAVPGYEPISSKTIEQLEEWVGQLHEQIEPLKEFILPGGCQAAAYCHLSRAICRRAERRVVATQELEVLALPLQYLNRLSDVLFILARVLNKQAKVSDVLWQKNRGK